VADGRGAFFDDRKTRQATLRELHEIAESTQQLSEGLKGQRPEVPWSAIVGFRNVVVHDYLGINLERVWTIVRRDLPPLRSAVLAMLEALDSGA
jgi:uncharacterized protein with HEPN domain